MSIYGRTDLASEAHEIWRNSSEQNTKLGGVIARQEELFNHNVTAVEIINDEGSRALRKPCGKYYTLELDTHFERGSESFPDVVMAIAELLSRCADLSGMQSFLIAALGNPDITPDALGPLAASNIIVTRHLKASSPEAFSTFKVSSLCRTGVLGTTGIESSAQIKSLCQLIKPDCLIAIDALAGASVNTLCRSVQICNTGISPGSGVGNNRAALNSSELGIPVIAIGMPTVIDAASLSSDAAFGSMFVTPRDIDSSVRSAGRLIGYGVNLAMHRELTIADIDMLVG